MISLTGTFLKEYPNSFTTKNDVEVNEKVLCIQPEGWLKYMRVHVPQDYKTGKIGEVVTLEGLHIKSFLFIGGKRKKGQYSFLIPNK